MTKSLPYCLQIPLLAYTTERFLHEIVTLEPSVLNNHFGIFVNLSGGFIEYDGLEKYSPKLYLFGAIIT